MNPLDSLDQVSWKRPAKHMATLGSRLASEGKVWARAERLWISIPALIASIFVAGMTVYCLARWGTFSIHDWLENLQAVLTSLAVVVGGLWFVHRRGHYPRAEISHAVSRVPLDGEVLLIVQVKIANKGDLKINLSNGEYEIRTVPRSEHPIKRKPLVDENVDENEVREVEGGETEELWIEVKLSSDLRVCSIYTYIPNPYRDDGTCWDKLTYFSVEDNKVLV